MCSICHRATATARGAARQRGPPPLRLRQVHYSVSYVLLYFYRYRIILCTVYDRTLDCDRCNWTVMLPYCDCLPLHLVAMKPLSIFCTLLIPQYFVSFYTVMFVLKCQNYYLYCAVYYTCNSVLRNA